MAADGMNRNGADATPIAAGEHREPLQRPITMTCPPFHIVTPVWGKVYTNIFTQLTLPALLAEGNLPALPNRARNLYQIITTERDRIAIRASAVFKRFAREIPVQFQIIDEPRDDTDRHVLQSHCNRLGIHTADAHGAASVFLNPDVIVADGGMRSLARMVSTGKRAINVLGIRMIRERVVPELMKHRSSDGSQLTISPRQLVGVAMTALHPFSMMHVFHAPGYDWLPSCIFWPVGKQGLIARCFHLHPMCVYPRVKNAPFTTTIDDDYLRAACPDPADEYVVLDSDEFCAVEMSGLDRICRSIPRPPGVGGYVEWAFNNAKPHHLELFCHRILIRSTDADSAAWRAVARESDKIAAHILQGVADRQLLEGFDRFSSRRASG